MSKRKQNDPANQSTSRRQFLKRSAGALAFTGSVWIQSRTPMRAVSAPLQTKPFAFDETTLADLQQAMQSGQQTAHSIAELYLARVDEIDKHGPAVNSVIEINPDALAIADALDRERKAKGARGPLHGVPVFIKDNIDTAGAFLASWALPAFIQYLARST